MMQDFQMTLDDLLADPITRLVMRRDGVSEDEIRRLMAKVAGRRRERLNASEEN